VVINALVRSNLGGMERAAWTDERLDDLARRMDAGFERMDADIRELRREVAGMRIELRGEIDGVRTGLGGQIDALRMTTLQVGGGIMVGLVGVIAAILARGG
jgi:hypothetical protein